MTDRFRQVVNLTVLCASLMLLEGIAAAAVVKVEGGHVEGVVENGLKVYRGIPFAAPPVGELRWRAPQSVKPWRGVRRADKFASPCMQVAGPATAVLRPSEDCLYLNVWTAAGRPEERRPVYVFIYGGGNNEGSTAVPVYDGETLARKGIVVVTLRRR